MDSITWLAIFFAFTTIITIVMYSLKTTKCNQIDNTKSLVGTTANIIPTVDIQFSPLNFPTIVYEDLFAGQNVWQGGFNSSQNTGRQTKLTSSTV